MSKKGYIIGAIVLMVIVVFILLSGGENELPVEVVKSATVTLATIEDSGVSGTATITEVVGKAKVVLALTGFTPDIAHPNHLHIGTCAELGEVKYSLTASTNGASETVLDVSYDQLMSELPLALNVHKTENKMDVNVACGDLVLASADGDQTGDTVLVGDEIPLENPESQ